MIEVSSWAPDQGLNLAPVDGGSDAIAGFKTDSKESRCLGRHDIQIDQQFFGFQRRRIGNSRFQKAGLESDRTSPHGFEGCLDGPQGFVASIQAFHGSGLPHHEAVAEHESEAHQEQRYQCLEQGETVSDALVRRWLHEIPF